MDPNSPGDPQSQPFHAMQRIASTTVLLNDGIGGFSRTGLPEMIDAPWADHIHASESMWNYCMHDQTMLIGVVLEGLTTWCQANSCIESGKGSEDSTRRLRLHFWRGLGWNKQCWVVRSLRIEDHPRTTINRFLRQRVGFMCKTSPNAAFDTKVLPRYGQQSLSWPSLALSREAFNREARRRVDIAQIRNAAGVAVARNKT